MFWKTKKDKLIDDLQLRLDTLTGENLLLRTLQKNVVKVGSVLEIQNDAPLPAYGYIKMQLSQSLANEIASHMDVKLEETGGRRVYRATISIVEE